MEDADSDSQAPTAQLSLTQLLAPPTITIGSGRRALSYTPQSPAWHCAFSRNGEWLAASFGATHPCVRLWRRDEKDQWALHSTLEGIHQRTIRCVAFAPLSPILAAASFDGTVSIWEYNTHPEVLAWECTTQLEGHENEVKYVAWNATGSLLATCGRDKTYVWVVRIYC